MKKTKEAAAEAEAECFRVLGFEGKARIVEMEFLDGLAELLEV